ncbi:hypothetical protein F441_03456 [Phytophthora nicotianae CJ01A1]|uniref:Uncharacterized protein n=4 Tax=Phytophthora nicotianae TaxID=4792 RepID=V9FTQ1_PHYNI|nr:hypothetical protein F443_03005 [Phytophthora nicotianae P1569]ETP23423.1 hypothetical protein F441_03456 [Phytophthora nicotianae CJ01A1]
MMATGTTTNDKGSLKEDSPGQGARVHDRPDTHLPPAAGEGESQTKFPYSGSSHLSKLGGGDNGERNGSDQSPVSCQRSGVAEKRELPTMASSTIVCGGGCVAAAERATSGGCPGCECPAGNCPCTKCGCPLCGQTQKATRPTPCSGGNEAGKRATAGNCPGCGCPSGSCPCTSCQCPICKST